MFWIPSSDLSKLLPLHFPLLNHHVLLMCHSPNIQPWCVCVCVTVSLCTRTFAHTHLNLSLTPWTSFLLIVPTFPPPHNVFFQKAVLHATSASLVLSLLQSGCGLLAIAQKPLLPHPQSSLCCTADRSLLFYPPLSGSELRKHPSAHTSSLGCHGLPASVFQLSGKQRTPSKHLLME